MLHFKKPALGWTTALLGLTLALWVSSASAFDWGMGTTVKGSGQVTTVKRAVSGFNGVSVDLSAKVEVIQGDTEGVSVETDDNLQALVETVVEGGQLRIRTSKRSTNLRPTRLVVSVNVRNLEQLSIAGSSEVHAARLNSSKFKASIAGSGDVRVDAFEGDTVNLSIAGSGDVVMAGKANQVEASIAGSGKLSLGKLNTKNVKIKVAGSGDATVWATQALAVSVAGSGDVRYYGDATVSNSVAGSGSVARLGAAPTN